MSESRITTVLCQRCRVAVPITALDMANRCTDPRCPLVPTQQRSCCEGEQAQPEKP